MYTRSLLHLATASVVFVSSFAAASVACGGDSSGDAGNNPQNDGGGGTSSSSSGDNGDGATNESDGAPIEPEPVGPPAVQFLGRFDRRDPKGPACAWPGCRIQVRFQVPIAGVTSNVSVRLNELNETWMDGAPSEWDVSVDGALNPKLVMTKGEKEYLLTTNPLPPGKHVIELFKRSEAQNGVTQFISFNLGGATMLAPPNRKTRRIEIIGDSSVAGFGVEGVGQGPDCPGEDHAAKWQNFRKTLGVHLGEMFNAEVNGTVYSGKGIAKNIWHPDKETMPIIFPRANPNEAASTWDFGLFTPDVVIVMIGGNDFAIGQPVDEGPATLTDFTNAYDSFVTTIRSKYKDAHIFLVTSPSISDDEPPGRSTRTNVKSGIATVVTRRAAANDTKVYAVEPPVAQPSELTGCNGHGSPEFHQRVAMDLQAIVKSKTAW